MNPGRGTSPHVLVLPSWYPTPEAPLRGVFFQEQAIALRRAGVDVGVAYPDLRRLRSLSDGDWAKNRFQMSAATERGIPTVRSHGWNVPHSRIRAELFVHQARRLLGRYRDEFGTPDLVHAHAALWAGVAAARTAAESGPPYVITEHSSAFVRGRIEAWQERPIRQAYAGARRVLSVSRALADRLSRYVDSDEVEVVPNMIDTAFFTLPPVPRRSPPFDFVTVAALRRMKGLDVLLRAFRAAFPSDPRVRLRIVGGGPLGRELKDLAATLAITDRVDFEGRLARHAVREVMWKSNAAVLPSRAETFGIVVIEAMATGLPVVATRSGGPEEIVTPETGRLVNPDDVEQLAAGLRWVWKREDDLRERAVAIRGYVEDRYSEEVVTARLKETYRTVLRRRGSDARRRSGGKGFDA